MHLMWQSRRVHGLWCRACTIKPATSAASRRSPPDARVDASSLPLARCAPGALLGAPPHVEVRCYISCFRCLARNARCNTMSHLTADALFSFTSRAKRMM